MPVFVDTNVLVYRFDTSEPDKQARAEEWLRHLWRTGDGRLSVQVLQEFYAVLTRKMSQPLPPESVRSAVRALFAWSPLPMTSALLEAAWPLTDRYALSWWDALVVAAAQRSGCERLLTEDLSEGQDLAGVTVVNPFRTPPRDVPG